MNLRRTTGPRTTGPRDHGPEENAASGSPGAESRITHHASRTTRHPPLLTSHAPSLLAFTMIEIAICLAVIGFALAAIVGVLPLGMNVQRENREETVIDKDASVFIDAIRNGQMGLDD